MAAFVLTRTIQLIDGQASPANKQHVLDIRKTQEFYYATELGHGTKGICSGPWPALYIA